MHVLTEGRGLLWSAVAKSRMCGNVSFYLHPVLHQFKVVRPHLQPAGFNVSK